MDKLRPLIRVEFLTTFKINALSRRSRDKRTRFNVVARLVTYIVLAILTGFGSWFSGLALAVMGPATALFPTLILNVSVFVFIYTLYKQFALYDRRDLEQLLSLPVRVPTLVLAKLSVPLGLCLLFSLAVILPAGLAFGLVQAKSLLYYLQLALIALTTPLIPFSLALLLGLVFSLVLTNLHAGQTGWLRLLGRVVLVLAFAGLMVAYFYGVIQLSTSISLELILGVLDRLSRLGFLTDWVNQALLERQFSRLIAYLLLQLAMIAGSVFLVAQSFVPLNERRAASGPAPVGMLRALPLRSPRRAAYFLELKRYFSVTIYVFNTLSLAILSLALVVTVIIMGTGTLSRLLNLSAAAAATLQHQVINFLPLIATGMLPLNSTTNAAVSIEGRTFWLTGSLPLQPAVVYGAKILVNLTLFLPVGFLSALLLASRFPVRGLSLVSLFLTPLAAVILVAVLGLQLNLRFPNFDYKSPVDIVKSGLPVMLSVLSGMVLWGLLFAVTLLTGTVGLIVLDLLILLAAGLIWRRLRLKPFQSIQAE